ncbi:macro domain-containing protein [Microcoleus sp. EPA2]|uniref:macro domain-containing protein n=1 Tax=Microcoleus sp. EPA2 TaxID=2841654 RepID=UPI00312B52C0
MGKIVVLSFTAGDCEQGFQHVSLEIKEDNHRPLKKIDGNLPSAPQIPQLYNTWQSKYRQMGSRVRIEPKSGQVTNYSICDLEADSDALRQQLNDWLTSPGFSRAINILGMTVSQNEEVRVIIQTEDLNLRRLPWHLWEFFDHYQKAQVALSSTAYQQIDSQRNRNQVRVLAIIGDSTGINLERDKHELKRNLPNAEIVFVTQPERREVYDAIWDAGGWDILFFAGHSLSASDATTGKLFIKQGESLEVKDMKAALRKAIGRGLKLAIFNSCDGLGIAKQLAELNMPQVIVMREPVPDVVAQEFLKRFLEAFARGESLYLAVREARERLESVQGEFPCATWLPVLCQNPAEEPVSWQELSSQVQDQVNQPCAQDEMNQSYFQPNLSKNQSKRSQNQPFFEGMIGRSRLIIKYCDITTLNVDVIVSSDDTDISMGGGVSKAILIGGGNSVWEEVRIKSPVELGSIAITKAGKLKANKIFHCAVLNNYNPAFTNIDLIRDVTTKCLNTCDRLGFHSIAFPALATGAARLSPEESAFAMISEIVSHLRGETSIALVILALYARPELPGNIISIFHAQVSELLNNVQSSEMKIYCQYCGSENVADVMFCESCGSLLRK